MTAPNGRRGFDAVAGLTVYLVLSTVIPAGATISGLNSYGRPSQLWGLCLLFWWVIDHLARPRAAGLRVWRPVRPAFGFLFVVGAVSFAAALLRGQPLDQVSPTYSGFLRLASWAGVFLIAVDGIDSVQQVRTVMRRFVWAACFEALVGLAQFLTGQTLVDRIQLPGLTVSDPAGVQARGSFVRALGTTTHPLEYGAIICMAVPMALALAVTSRRDPAVAQRAVPGSPEWLARWAPAGLLAGAVLISASRSALLGFAVAVVAVIPGLPVFARRVLIGGGVLMVCAVMVAVPGMAHTMQGFFTGAPDDPSTLSRTNGLAAAPGFIAASPVFGTGLGTFLPRYYIFDDAWVLLTVELGVVGLIAFALLLATGVGSALRARWVSRAADVVGMGQALAAAVLTAAVIFAGFDGLSFPVSAGMLFLTLGLCGALLAAASRDRAESWTGALHAPRRHYSPQEPSIR